MNRSINPYLGSIIGRTTNRISNSVFILNGVTYTLDKNDGENSLHGGFSGFDMVANSSLKIEECFINILN